MLATTLSEKNGQYGKYFLSGVFHGAWRPLYGPKTRNTGNQGLFRFWRCVNGQPPVLRMQGWRLFVCKACFTGGSSRSFGYLDIVEEPAVGRSCGPLRLAERDLGVFGDLNSGEIDFGSDP